MYPSRNKLERLGIGLVLTVSLLTFLTPMVRLRGPSGDLQGSGYHVRDSMKQMTSMLTAVTATQENQREGQPRIAGSPSQVLEVPFSLRVSWLTPWMIYLAMGCACLALLDLVSFGRSVGKLSLAGGSLAGVAVVHVVLMGSDLQAWATRLLNSGLLYSNDSVIMSARLLVVNSFQAGVGLGLVGLSAALFLASFTASTSVVSRITSVVRREPRFRASQPVRVRPLHPNYAEDICSSVNLSRTGLLLESSTDHYYVGMEVYVTRNARATQQPEPEEHGSIVRVEHLQGGGCRFAIAIFSHAERDAATGRAVKDEEKSKHPIEIGAGSL